MNKLIDKIKKDVWRDCHYRYSDVYPYEITMLLLADGSVGDMWWFTWNQIGEDLNDR
jgi:hypothetical protein